MAESEYGVRPPNSPDIADLAVGETAPPGDRRHEPVLAFSAPRGASEAVIRLDPARVGFEPSPTPAERGWPRGPIDSLILHLLPLVMIAFWPSQPPADIPVPIPVALVIEPPPRPAEPTPPANPPQGRRASDDFAEAAAPKPEKGAGDAPPSAGEPQMPAAETRTASAPPPPSPPEPDRPTEPASAASQPADAEPRVAAVTPPPVPPKPAAAKPTPPTQATLRTPKPLGGAWPLPLYQPRPPAASHLARLTGPSAARDEYCARLLSLTLRNIGMLPLAAIGTRTGETTVTFRLEGDGTVNSVKVARSSGYPDIDEKIARMVIAVGAFPPLPQWIPGSWMDFTFDLHFPHPLQR